MAEHSTHSTQRRYPPELRERAVRLVAETASERGDRHGAVTLVARQLGIGPEIVRARLTQAVYLPLIASAAAREQVGVARPEGLEPPTL